MKQTIDGHFVNDHEEVWEILYQRFNEETSMAYPEIVNAGNTNGRIWKDRFPCSMECLKINKKNQYVPLEEPELTVKMLSEWTR